jgi:FMN phosphatase YigB (HAD superfamily)
MNIWLQHIAALPCLMIGLISSISAITFTPYNTIIQMDLDEVVITRSRGLEPAIFGKIVSLNPLKTYRRANAFWQMKKKSEVQGTTHQMIDMGFNDPELRPYLGSIAQLIITYRELIPGMLEILTYLKEDKGYRIDFATNKDRISYDDVAAKLGTKFSGLADHVIVSEPELDAKTKTRYEKLSTAPHLPADFKKLIDRQLNVKETNRIHHALGMKPSYELYGKKQREIADKYWKNPGTPHILFFDDKQANVDSANENHDKRMMGFLFKNPSQFIDTLLALGILAEKTDHAFLHTLRKQGIITSCKPTHTVNLLPKLRRLEFGS